MTGYSDRINHAFAFAAKHHDQQVRKGTRLPYLTHPANVAVILTRYGCGEDTIVAGILHDVVGDSVREGMTRDMLEERIDHKFGTGVLATVLAVTQRRVDDDGIEMSADALWVCAADKVHNANTILSDLRRTAFPETIWGRLSAGRDGTVKWYRRVADRLREIGFHAPIVAELEHAVAGLEGA
jgi:(p)ppGpp synthase/HD superfamily hydrolase